MRDFVQAISSYTKGIKTNFIIIPQNGHELLTENGEATGSPTRDYLDAIDVIGREDLFYGYDEDNLATQASERYRMTALIDIAEKKGVEVLVTDYCWTQSLVDDSYSQNSVRGYISFAADHRELDNIPIYPQTPYNVNTSEITSLAQAMNFLYLLNPDTYDTKTVFLNTIQSTNYDIVIIDLFYDGTEELSVREVAALKAKANGGARLVIAYMSIGEAEDYRYYWQTKWETSPPSWLAKENQDWEGN